MEPNHNIALGGRGEDRAAHLYESLGYRVVQRNWRCRAGEIDLICSIGRRIVFCEVKSRSSNAHGHPLEAVTPAKQKRVRQLAAHYLVGQSEYWEEIRFDVAAVLGDTLHLVKGAF